MAPALLVGVLSASVEVVTPAFVIALGHAFILGLPLLGIFWRKRWINAFLATLSGFAIGATGIAILTWPLWYQGPTAWTGGVQTIVDGVPTLAGWLEYLQAVVTFGAFGAAGGFMFWLWLAKAHALPGAGLVGAAQSAGRRRGSVILRLSSFVFAIGHTRRDQWERKWGGIRNGVELELSPTHSVART